MLVYSSSRSTCNSISTDTIMVIEAKLVCTVNTDRGSFTGASSRSSSFTKIVRCVRVERRNTGVVRFVNALGSCGETHVLTAAVMRFSIPPFFFERREKSLTLERVETATHLNPPGRLFRS